MELEDIGREEILKAVADLPEEYRGACFMHYSEQLPAKEIAARMNISVRIAYKKINRGKFLLKAHFRTDDYRKGMQILYGNFPNRVYVQ